MSPARSFANDGSPILLDSARGYRESELESVHPRTFKPHRPPQLDEGQAAFGHVALYRLGADPHELCHLRFREERFMAFLVCLCRFWWLHVSLARSQLRGEESHPSGR